MPKHRLYIAEDRTIVRQGLRALIESVNDFEVVGEAEDGLEAIKGVEKIQPDLVLLDLSMPKLNGISALKEIKRVRPEIKIIVLTIHNDEEYILEAFEAGADGYCLKSAEFDEIVLAIKTVLMGKPYMSGDVSEKVLEGYLEGRKHIKSQTSFDTLTQREKEILKLIGEGHRNKEIADLLCISEKTVNKHRSNIMQKLDMHNVANLTAFAIEKGLVTT